MATTPGDMIAGLRLMKANADWLLEPGDDDDTKATVQGLVASYVAAKRAGTVAADTELRDWYETADLADFMPDEGGSDPTG